MPIDSFSQFKEHSVAEFFKKNKQMLGFSGKVRSLTTIVHEFTSNSLDAGEEVGILPEIFIQLEEEGDDKYKIAVQDNCGGIPEKYLGKALGQGEAMAVLPPLEPTGWRACRRLEGQR